MLPSFLPPFKPMNLLATWQPQAKPPKIYLGSLLPYGRILQAGVPDLNPCHTPVEMRNGSRHTLSTSSGKQYHDVGSIKHRLSSALPIKVAAPRTCGCSCMCSQDSPCIHDDFFIGQKFGPRGPYHFSTF